MPLMLKGELAAVQWGYHQAATVRGWSLTPSKSGGTVTGTLDDANRVQLGQRPLTLIVRHQHGEWRWPILDLQLDGGRLTATLGQPEAVPHGA
jgi:hypothetical protein